MSECWLRLIQKKPQKTSEHFVTPAKEACQGKKTEYLDLPVFKCKLEGKYQLQWEQNSGL